MHLFDYIFVVAFVFYFKMYLSIGDFLQATILLSSENKKLSVLTSAGKHGGCGRNPKQISNGAQYRPFDYAIQFL